MYNLNLSTEEQQALIDVLETSISELHQEIMHTDRWDLKSALKARKQVLLNMLENARMVQQAAA